MEKKYLNESRYKKASVRKRRSSLTSSFFKHTLH